MLIALLLAAVAPAVSLPDTRVEHLASRKTEISYRLHVSVPPDFEQRDARYPVVLLLDADYSFPIAHAVAVLKGELEWTRDRLRPNELVNRIREKVGLWRRGGYAGTTATTARLCVGMLLRQKRGLPTGHLAGGDAIQTETTSNWRSGPRS